MSRTIDTEPVLKALGLACAREMGYMLLEVNATCPLIWGFWGFCPQKSVSCASAREMGFLPVEVNASDTRNKADASALKGVAGKLANGLRELTTNTSMHFGINDSAKRACPPFNCLKLFEHQHKRL